MTKGEAFHQYQHMSADEKRTFDRWLRLNAVVATVFAAGLLAMSLASTFTPGPRSALAQNILGIDVSAAAKNHRQNEFLSVRELMLRTDVNQLPEHKVHEPY
jgi:hypothetical protein